ncbi:MAG TPA: cytochrome P450 [Candidatus Binatia bacterium]|jgi:cytochrome P450|nr:cytochrome P450 [Candidatus Binatia bacterium]
MTAGAMSVAPEFDPFSATFFDDPYDTYRALRDQAPVYHNARYGFWALSRFDDVAAAHQDWRTFSSAHGVTLHDLCRDDFRAVGSIIYLDPPGHERLRNLVSKAFTPRAIAALEPMIRAVVDETLDRVVGQARFDAVADFAAPFPVEVISVMLGVPPADRQAVRLRTDLMLHREPNDPGPTAAGMEAGIAQTRYLMALAAEKRRQPGDDMITRLCEAELPAPDGPQRLNDLEIASFAALLGAAGSETVTKLVGNGIVLFHRFPEQWAAVLDDPTRIPDAIEEILRYWAPSQYQGRFTTAPSTFHGVTIPAGVPVLLLTGAASRDERGYPEPDRFDIGRERNLPLGFGYGIHSCLGAALARIESRIAFEALRTRHPRFRVDESGLRRVHMTNVAGFSQVPVDV